MTSEPTGTEPAAAPQPRPTPPLVPAPRPASEPMTAGRPAAGGPGGDVAADAAGLRGDGAADLVGDGPDTDLAGGRNWPVVLGTIIMVVLGIGWALLSRFAFHDAVTDAVAEGIGAALGLLIAVSVVGAIVSARKHRDRPAGS
jgi:hypothetical protein